VIITLFFLEEEVVESPSARCDSGAPLAGRGHGLLLLQPITTKLFIAYQKGTTKYGRTSRQLIGQVGIKNSICF